MKPKWSWSHWEEERKSNSNCSLSFKYSGLVIGTKNEYKHKRKYQLYATLAEELTQNQINNYDPYDLSRRIECIELESINKSDEISNDLKRSNMQWIGRD